MARIMAILALLLPALITAQEEPLLYESETYHFKLRLPVGWIQVPDDVVDQYFRALSAFTKGRQNKKPLACFGLKSQERWFEYPYIAIMADSSGPPSQQELESFQRMSLKELDTVSESVQSRLPALISKIQVGKPFLDTESHAIWICAKIKATTGDEKAGVSVVKPTKSGSIQAMYYSNSSDVKAAAVEAAFLADAIQVESAHEQRSLWAKAIANTSSAADFSEGASSSSARSGASFLRSVSAGVASLFDWHILLGIAGVSAASLLYLIISGLIVGNSDSGPRMGAGCLLVLFGGPLVQILSISGFILLFLPAVIGNGGFTPSEIVGPLLWPVLKSGFWAMLLVIAIGIIPIVGGIVSNTPGVPLFLQGIFMLKPTTQKLFYAMSNGRELSDDAFPSFWQCIGYVVIALALCYAGIAIAAIISDQIKKRRDPVGHMMSRYSRDSSQVGVLIGMLIGPALGILPLLMYGKYIGLSIQSQQ